MLPLILPLPPEVAYPHTESFLEEWAILCLLHAGLGILTACSEQIHI